jgi:hypothetical protein
LRRWRASAQDREGNSPLARPGFEHPAPAGSRPYAEHNRGAYARAEAGCATRRACARGSGAPLLDDVPAAVNRRRRVVADFKPAVLVADPMLLRRRSSPIARSISAHDPTRDRREERGAAGAFGARPRLAARPAAHAGSIRGSLLEFPGDSLATAPTRPRMRRIARGADDRQLPAEGGGCSCSSSQR